MKSTTATLFATIAALTFSTSSASPLGLHAREVFNPPVTDPHSGTIWVIGTTRNVTWDASNPPPRISGGTLIQFAEGGLLLQTGPGSFNDPLASGFSLLTGFQEITVPEVEPGEDYQVVLFGSSDNLSQVFTVSQ